jgi:hypothetical protein
MWPAMLNTVTLLRFDEVPPMTDDENATKLLKQVVWALLRLHTSSFTSADVQEAYLKDNQDQPRDVTDVLTQFTTLGYLQHAGDRYSITEAGNAYLDAVRGEDFGEGLLRIDDSKAYSRFCELVYGTDLCQFSMVSMDQLAKLIELLDLDAGSRVLDLGCSVGRITEHISDATGAHVTGLDFAAPAIRRAQERTRDKNQRLEALKPEFEAEGSTQLYEDRVKETQAVLAEVAAGKISRYLYHVRV